MGRILWLEDRTPRLPDLGIYAQGSENRIPGNRLFNSELIPCQDTPHVGSLTLYALGGHQEPEAPNSLTICCFCGSCSPCGHCDL